MNYEQVVRKVCCEVGFDADCKGLDGKSCAVILNVQSQDANIANAVHGNKDETDVGAGDQGLMFGYATDEWDKETLHPYSHHLAQLICLEMAIARKDGSIGWLRPDCKSQVIVEYKQEEDGRVTPMRVYNILIST